MHSHLRVALRRRASRVGGRMSGTEQDKFPATVVVHLPTGPMPSCDAHAQRMVSLMRFMGVHAFVEPDDGFARYMRCVNCVSEAAKREASK